MVIETIIKIAHGYPLISIIIFSFAVTLALTLLYKKFTNQQEIKELKEKTKTLQEKIKAEKDQEKIMAMQKEMLGLSMEQMRHNMRPMLITFLPLIAVFAALRTLYANVGVIVPWSFDIPIFCQIPLIKGLCDGAGWLLCYIFFSFFFSIFLRKVLGVH